jgi:hypothetical protein
MLVVSLLNFLAANTALSPKKLQDGIGVDAQNLDTEQGDFRGRRAASVVHTLTGLATQQISLYRIPRGTASDTTYWLTSSLDLDYAQSLVAGDTTDRTYVTGLAGGPAYTDNTYLGAPPYPTGYVDLGVPAPSGAMTLAVNVAGTGPTETRVYVDTFSRANGDQSAPNTTSSTISCAGGSTINISNLPAPPGGAHGITTREIFVSTSGGDFQRVLQQAAATTTASDSLTRGAVLQTGGSTTKPAWLTPSATLKGITELWNGMHGAFDGKSYYVCVPYQPHAWPIEYRRVIPDTIVGTATFGENWVLATTGMPRVVNGNAPLGMANRPIKWRQACVSKRSVRSVGHGVCWASAEGLAYFGERGTMLLTKNILTRAQWQALVPSTIIGACWKNWYIGFYNDGARKGFMIDTLNPAGIIWLSQGAYGVFEDTVSESLHILDTAYAVRKWDSGSAGSATFKSRIFRHPRITTPSVARVVATTYPVTFSLWADGALKVNAQSITSDAGFRLPGGYAAEEFQVQVSGNGPVEAVFVAEETEDMP